MVPPDDGYDEDDDVADVTPAEPSWLQRLLSPTAAPTVRPDADGTLPTTKWSVDRLDGRERLYAYGSGVVAAAFAVLIYVVETNDKHFKLTKNQFTPQTTLIVGLVCAALLIVTTRIGRRALVGFVALFTFLGFSNSDFIIGVPFLILAVWLLYRSYKVQKEASARLKAERAEGKAPPGSDRSGRSAGSAAGRNAAETRSERAARKKGPAGPEANKRFTPKKPTRPPPPPPKPSRWERRAAKTSD